MSGSKTVRWLAPIMLVAGLTPSGSEAEVIYEQPLDSWSTGWCSPCIGQLPPSSYDHRVYASFTLDSEATVRSATFAIHDIGIASDDLNIAIWDEPEGTQLFSIDLTGAQYTKAPGGDGNGTYYAVVDLPEWYLDSGSYWISLFGSNGNFLGWGTDGRLGDDQQYSGLDGLISSNRYVGFSLSDTPSGGEPVPEPFSLALWGAGLVGVGLARRRYS